ncbi:MAG: hypothetical protein WKG32_17230 [Gemmatimonadaceae bacterium]
MLIDELLPDPDVVSRHAIDVAAPVADTFAALRRADLSRSRVIRALFALRGIPAACARSLADMDRMGFTLLGERAPHEMVMGLVGRFWSPHGDIVRVRADEFRGFDRAGYAKAVWGFALTATPGGATHLATETRVLCLDPASRARFRLYWSVIGPFSGIIRREILRAVEREASSGLGTRH